MITTAFLQAWGLKAPWPDMRQVEQDLIICRALLRPVQRTGVTVDAVRDRRRDAPSPRPPRQR